MRCVSYVIDACLIYLHICVSLVSKGVWCENLGGRHCWGRDVQFLPDVLGWWAGEAKQRAVCFLCFLLRHLFSSFLNIFSSLLSRCVSVGPPVYSWGRIWPIGGHISAKDWPSLQFFVYQLSLLNIWPNVIFTEFSFLYSSQHSFQGVFLTSPILKPPLWPKLGATDDNVQIFEDLR